MSTNLQNLETDMIKQTLSITIFIVIGILYIQSHRLISMDRPLVILTPTVTYRTQPLLGANFVDNNLLTRQFFVPKPYPTTPGNLHLMGIPCAGHGHDPLYPFVNADIYTLGLMTRQAHECADDHAAWHFIRCSRFLEAYQDATCSCIQSKQERLDALESMFKIVPGIAPLVTFQPVARDAYRQAIHITNTLAHEGNARALYMLATLNASFAESYATRACSLAGKIFEKKSDDECRQLLHRFDVHTLINLYPHDARIQRLTQEFLSERGTEAEKRASWEYFIKEASYGNLRATCYCAHALLEKNQPEESYEHIKTLMSCHEGRLLLAEFAHRCDPLPAILNDPRQAENSIAGTIKGLVMYHQGNHRQAFSLLNSITDFQVQPYIFFSLATMYKDGHGTKKNLDKAIYFYRKALSLPHDHQLEEQIQQVMHELAYRGCIAARSELLLDAISKTTDYTTIDSLLDPFWDMTLKEREPYINSIKNHEQLSPRDPHKIEYLLATLYTMQAFKEQDLFQKINYLKQALNSFEKLEVAVIDLRNHCATIAYWISILCQQQHDYKLAVIYAQKAIALGHPEAHYALAMAYLADTESLQKDFDASIQTLIDRLEKEDTEKYNPSMICFGNTRKISFSDSHDLHSLMVQALERACSRHDLRVYCLLARLYAFNRDTQSVQLATKLLSFVLQSTQGEKLAGLLRSTKSENVLRLMAQSGDIQACKQLGLVLFHDHNYEDAYRNFNIACKAQDLESTCYCIYMLIHGIGTTQLLKEAHKRAQGLCKTEAGRKILPLLAQLANEQTVQLLSKEVQKGNKHASFLQGIILYHRHENPEQVLICLRPMAEQKNPYACYLCAHLLPDMPDKQPSTSTILSSPVDVKVKQLKKALEYCAVACKHLLASENMSGAIANQLANAYYQQGKEEKALKAYEYAMQQGNGAAKATLQAYRTLNSQDTMPEAREKAVDYLEKSAEKGDAIHQKMLAFYYQGHNKAKSYNYAELYLSAHPDDQEICYLAGTLLCLNAGQAGIPARQSRAYDLLSVAVDHLGGTDHVYYWLGHYCFEKNDLTQALSWFNRAPECFLCNVYRGLAMLMLAYKGIQETDKTLAYDHLEKTFFNRNEIALACTCWTHEIEAFIKNFKQSIPENDTRAYALLGRLKFLCKEGSQEISMHEALEYLKKAADVGNPYAQSTLGLIYSHNLDGLSYERKAFEYFAQALCSQNLPDYLIREIREEIHTMMSKSSISKETLYAAYNMVTSLIHHGNQLCLLQAFNLFNSCEDYVIKNFGSDRSLVDLYNESGARHALKQAVDQGNTDAAAYFGISLVERFMKELCSFDEIKNEAFPALEHALKAHNSMINSLSIVRNFYLPCYTCAIARHICSASDLKPLLERALILDPQNPEILCELALLTNQEKLDHITQKELYGHLAKQVRPTYSLCFKLAIALTEKNLSVLQAIFKNIIKELETHVTSRQDAVTQLSDLGIQALLSSKHDQAVCYFQQLADTFLVPEGYGQAAMIKFYLNNDVAGAVSLLIKALDLSAKQEKELDLGILHCMLNIMHSLDTRKVTDKICAKLAVILRYKLDQHHISIS